MEMDKETKKEMSEKLNKMTGIQIQDFLDLDDEINFGCTQCGGCCMDNSKTMVSPFDVYSMAKAKGVTIGEFLQQYCGVHIGQSSCVPMITLNLVDQSCVMLDLNIKTGKFECTVGDAKPGNCIMFPIGAGNRFDKILGKQDKFFFLTQGCKKCDKSVKTTVRDHLAPYLVAEKERDTAFQLMTVFTDYIDLEKLVKTAIRPDMEYIDKTYAPKEKPFKLFMFYLTNADAIEMFTQMYIAEYLDAVYNFDLNRPFLDQIDERVKEIQIAALELHKMLDQFGVDIERDGAFAKIPQEVMEEFKKKVEEESRGKTNDAE